MNYQEQKSKLSDIDQKIKELQGERSKLLEKGTWMFYKSGDYIREWKVYPHAKNPRICVDSDGYEFVVGRDIFLTKDETIKYWETFYETQIQHHERLAKTNREFLDGLRKANGL